MKVPYFLFWKIKVNVSLNKIVSYLNFKNKNVYYDLFTFYQGTLVAFTRLNFEVNFYTSNKPN